MGKILYAPQKKPKPKPSSQRSVVGRSSVIQPRSRQTTHPPLSLTTDLAGIPARTGGGAPHNIPPILSPKIPAMAQKHGKAKHKDLSVAPNSGEGSLSNILKSNIPQGTKTLPIAQAQQGRRLQLNFGPSLSDDLKVKKKAVTKTQPTVPKQVSKFPPLYSPTCLPNNLKGKKPKEAGQKPPFDITAPQDIAKNLKKAKMNFANDMYGFIKWMDEKKAELIGYKNLYKKDDHAFESMVGSLVGSIYFRKESDESGGRLRLIHPYGPAVEHYNKVSRYTSQQIDYDKLDEVNGDIFHEYVKNDNEGTENTLLHEDRIGTGEFTRGLDDGALVKLSKAVQYSMQLKDSYIQNEKSKLKQTLSLEEEAQINKEAANYANGFLYVFMQSPEHSEFNGIPLNTMGNKYDAEIYKKPLSDFEALVNNTEANDLISQKQLAFESVLSIDGKNKGVDSLYFGKENGGPGVQIRLLNEDGPSIQSYDHVERYAEHEIDYNNIDNISKTNNHTLFERIENGFHESRGGIGTDGAVKGLTNEDFELLAKVVRYSQQLADDALSPMKKQLDEKYGPSDKWDENTYQKYERKLYTISVQAAQGANDFLYTFLQKHPKFKAIPLNCGEFEPTKDYDLGANDGMEIFNNWVNETKNLEPTTKPGATAVAPKKRMVQNN